MICSIYCECALCPGGHCSMQHAQQLSKPYKFNCSCSMSSSTQMHLHRVTAPSRDCGMRHLGNKHSTGRCFQFQVGIFFRKERCGKPGRRRRPMTYPCRCLHGSWGCAGRKPRVFRCLASKTRHRENRGFLPACPCDPRRQAGGMASPPDFPGLAFRSLS